MQETAQRGEVALRGAAAVAVESPAVVVDGLVANADLGWLQRDAVVVTHLEEVVELLCQLFLCVCEDNEVVSHATVVVAGHPAAHTGIVVERAHVGRRIAPAHDEAGETVESPFAVVWQPN